MKVLVAYISWTGNTKKIDEVIDIKTYDLIFAGFPTHGFGQMADEAKDFIEKYCAGKKIALFATHSAPEDSSFVPPWIENYKKAASGTDLIGLADFHGQIALDQVDLMLQQGDLKSLEILKNVVHSSIGQPDSSRIERARAFAKEIIKKIKI